MATQCPKCHQVVGEDYICCANIEFQWLCESCHKRSRGFVMPFGQCSLCGGALQKSELPEHPSKKSLLALQEAIQIEINAYHFYHHLAEATDDPETSDFFESLSAMEKEHAEELSQKYHIHLEPSIFGETDRPLPEPFFEHLCFFASTGDVNRLYDCAIALEKRTLDFFLRNSKNFALGAEKDLYLELAAEEREHITLLESQRDR